MLPIRCLVRFLPAKPATGLVALVLIVAPSLFSAPRASAAAYYVGGGKGVRLAVRVVDHQIVWMRTRVLNQCVGSRRGVYHYTESSEGLAGQVAIGRRGRFGWHDKAKTVGKNGDVAANGESFSGNFDGSRLVGRFLSYGWSVYTEPSGVHRHGYCRAGSRPPPPEQPTPVPITAVRRPEPRGLAFYFAAEKGGITAYFEVRRRQIVRAEVGALHLCTDRQGRRRHFRELSAFKAAIRIGPLGTFGVRQPKDEIRALEVLQGKVEPTRIIGRYGYSYGGGGGLCRTGSYEPGGGEPWALPFVALRH